MTDSKPQKSEAPAPITLCYEKTFQKTSYYYKHIEDKLPSLGPEFDYTQVHYEATEAEVNSCKINIDIYESAIDAFEKIIGFSDMKAFSLIFKGIEENRRSLCSEITKEGLEALYNDWKRRHEKNPMRFFWNRPNPNDNDTNKVFRPRDEGGIKTRPKRKNETDAYNKLKEMKDQIKSVMDILYDMLVRENKKKAICQLNSIEFDQRLGEEENKNVNHVDQNWQNFCINENIIAQELE